LISGTVKLVVLNKLKMSNRINALRRLDLDATGVFAVSVVIVLLFLGILPGTYKQNESTDYLNYYEPVARNLLRGSGLVGTDGLPAMSNPPGYPILLAGVFSLAGVTRLPESLMYSIFVLCCMGFSAVFIFLISRGIWGVQGGWLSALFFITYPFGLWLTKQPGSEVPFMLAFYAGLHLFWAGMGDRKNAGWFLVLCGFLMGIAMLIRGIALGSGVILFILFLVIKRNILLRRRFVLAGMILLGNLLAVLPWQVWAYRQTDQVILLGTNGVPSIRDGLTFAVNTKGYRQSVGLPEDVLALQDQFLEESGSMNTVGEIWEHVSFHFLREPLAFSKLILIKMTRSWYGTDSGSLEPVIAGIQGVYASVILLASILVWKYRTEYPGVLLVVWAIAFYFWVMTTLVLSILRYMVPAIGLFALLVPVFLRIPRLALFRLRSS
jgi:hypothetical protein